MQAAHALPSELTIYTVSEFYPQCLNWVNERTTDEVDESAVLCLDAQGVSDVDAAGVQLLLSMSNSLEKVNRQLLLSNPSQALSDACHAMGATCLMGATDVEVLKS